MIEYTYMHDSRPDEILFEDVVYGSGEAFQVFVERYTPILFNFIARSIGREHAEDVLQDIFMKVWMRRRSYKTELASVKTWMFTIARRTCIDFLRKKRAIPVSQITEDSESFFDEKMQEGDHTLPPVLPNEILDALLRKLPEPYKTVIILHYQEDLTLREIAKIIDKPENTVKSYHLRAIAMIRKDMHL